MRDFQGCFFVFLLWFLLMETGGFTAMQSGNINLPERIGHWKLDGPAHRIDRATIFDYMNGAGELYLGYHFSHLLVYRYRDKRGNEILVELYHMKDSRDAFGLLSLDWGGETVVLQDREKNPHRESIIPSGRALYGKGLLRVWSDNLYVRIMAFREAPGVREMVLELGKIITLNRKNPAPPVLLDVVTPKTDSGWVLRKDRTAYFYSHLVLNSLFYLSHENILNLGHETEALMAVFEKEPPPVGGKRIHLLVVKYPDPPRSHSALDAFVSAYLPELKLKPSPAREIANQDFFQVEDGWMGYCLQNRYLSLVFGCPDVESARGILKQVNWESF